MELVGSALTLGLVLVWVLFSMQWIKQWVKQTALALTLPGPKIHPILGNSRLATDSGK